MKKFWAVERVASNLRGVKRKKERKGGEEL